MAEFFNHKPKAEQLLPKFYKLILDWVGSIDTKGIHFVQCKARAGIFIEFFFRYHWTAVLELFLYSLILKIWYWTFSIGTIHLRRRHVLGGEGGSPLPTFADARGVGVLGLPTSAVNPQKSGHFYTITVFYFGKYLIDYIIRISLKFIYSEKATKFWEISTNYLSYVLPVK